MGMFLLRLNKYGRIYDSDNFDNVQNYYALVYKTHSKHSHLKIIWGHFIENDKDDADFISKEVVNLSTGDIAYDFIIYKQHKLLKNPYTDDIYLSESFEYIKNIYDNAKNSTITLNE